MTHNTTVEDLNLSCDAYIIRKHLFGTDESDCYAVAQTVINDYGYKLSVGLYDIIADFASWLITHIPSSENEGYGIFLIEDTHKKIMVLLEHHTRSDYGMGYKQYIPGHFFRSIYFSNDPAVYCKCGDACLDKENYDHAIENYSEAIRIDPDNAAAYKERGHIYHDKKKDYSHAISDYTELIRLIPNNADVYNWRGNSYRNKKDYDQAITDYTEAIRLNPDSANAYHNRGVAYQNGKKDYDHAIADYTEAIRLNPDYATAYFNRGLVYKDKKDYDQTVADFGQYIRLTPNDADAYYYRGEVYQNGKEDNDRAIADYTEAIRLDPNYAHAYGNRGVAYNAKGQKDLAIQDLEKQLSLGVNTDWVQARLAEVYIKRAGDSFDSGDHASTITDFTKAIELNPKNAIAYFKRGMAYHYSLKDYDKAVVDFEMAVKLAPDEDDFREYLGRAKAGKERGK